MKRYLAILLSTLLLLSSLPIVMAENDVSTVTIEFTDIANRISYSTEQQVWQQNGITVTNDKGASTSNVGNYGGDGYPARFYKGSVVTIEYPGMTQLVIHCEGLESKYVNGWADSAVGATATVDGGIVTIVFDGTVDSFTWETMSAQSRAYSITVYATNAPTTDEPGNLIVNGDFETGSADGWNTWQDTTISADAAHSGNYGAHLKGNGGWSGMLDQTIAVEYGATYKLSFRLHVVAVGVNVQVKNAFGDVIANTGGWFDTKTTNHPVEWTFIAYTGYVHINFCGSGSGKTEEAYVDDFVLVKVGGNTPDEPDVPVLPDVPVVPDTPAGDTILSADFDNGETAPIYSTSDISVVDGVLQFNVTKDWGNIYSEDVPAEKNTDYVISFSAKSKLGKSFWVKFNDSWAKDVASVDLHTTKEWKNYSFTMNSGNFGTLVFLILFAGTAAEGETLWIDNLTITKVGGSIPDTPDTPDVPADELIVNGDFETGDATGWDIWQNTEISADAAHSGNYGAYLQGNGGWGGLMSQYVTVVPGEEYTLSFWIHVIATGVNIQVKDGSGAGIEGAGGWFDAKNVAKVVEWTFTATDDTVFINFCGSGTNKAEEVYVDDFVLVKVGGDTPDTPDVPGGELLINGGFENGSEGWTLGSSASISDDARTGNGALRIENPGMWSEAASQTVAVEPNTNYVLNLWTKRLKGTLPFNLFIFDAKNFQNLNIIKGQNWFNFNNTDWMEHTIVFYTGSSTEVILKWSSETSNAGVILIDDMRLYKEGEQPDQPHDGAIVNGSFEIGDLTGWNNLWGACNYWFESPGHGGSQYALYQEAPGQWQQIRQDKIPVAKNTDYVLVAYAKNPRNMNIVIKDGDDWYNITELALENDLSNSWLRYEVPFNSGDLDSVCVLLITRGENGGYALWDDIQLYKAGEVPEAPEEPPVTEGPMQLDSFGTAINRPADEDKNLIENGSFENAAGGQWQSIADDLLYVVEDDTAPEGDKSLYFNTTGVEMNDKAIFYVDVEPDTDYIFSAWVKGAFISDDNRFNATFGVVDHRNNFLVHNDTVFSNRYRQIVPTCWDNEWHLRSVQFNSNVNTRVGIAFLGSYSQMWVDGIALFKVEDGVKYVGDKEAYEIPVTSENEEDGYCADADNLIPDSGMNGTASRDFWSQAYGYGNGFLSFEQNALKYTGDANSCGTHAIRWIDVEPNTDYTFSVDMRILQGGEGQLMLLDGRMRDPHAFMFIDFDPYSYGEDWFNVTITFHSGAFDQIGIAVMDGGGEALIDNMRLFDSQYRADKPIEKGDVNADGNINNRDLGLLMQYLNGWDVAVDEKACDLDGNGKLNNKDLGLLQRMLVQ